MPNLYIIGGANGSGKTTVALQILPYVLEVFEYVNADNIAAGISPFNSEAVDILIQTVALTSDLRFRDWMN